MAFLWLHTYISQNPVHTSSAHTHTHTHTHTPVSAALQWSWGGEQLVQVKISAILSTGVCVCTACKCVCLCVRAAYAQANLSLHWSLMGTKRWRNKGWRNRWEERLLGHQPICQTDRSQRWENEQGWGEVKHQGTRSKWNWARSKVTEKQQIFLASNQFGYFSCNHCSHSQCGLTCIY